MQNVDTKTSMKLNYVTIGGVIESMFEDGKAKDLNPYQIYQIDPTKVKPQGYETVVNELAENVYFWN